MKINWKVRFRNKAWVLAFLLGIIAMFYQFAKVYEVAKKVLPPQELMIETVKMLVAWLLELGIIVDPTTKGMADSKLAMSYTKPRAELGGEHTADFSDTAHEINDPADESTEHVEG